MLKNFVVYRSGAGSGKTFTLVKEYLRLALHDESRLEQNYRRILAVTFTNKAAAEMKSRVIETLHEIADAPENSSTGRMLCDELKISPADIKKRAQTVLTHLLHHYSDFAIGTIDSFTHKIVRTFAQELDLPVNFNVELDAQSFYIKVVSQLLSRVGEDEQVSRLLKEYVLTRAEDNAFWDPESNIREFTSLLLKENAPEYLSKLAHLDGPALENIHRDLQAFQARYRSHLMAGGQKALDLIQQHHLVDDDFNYARNGPQSFLRKCSRGTATLDDAHGTRITEAVRDQKWSGKGAGSATVKKLSGALTSLAAELVMYIERNHAHYSLCELLSRQMYGLMLLRKIEEISAQQKLEERVVFISEFNNKIFNLISEEPTPFIYERLGEKYHHYLLDEFQDTSSLQWHNLLPLLDNSLANGWYNLVVGDGKQSIYRWRNANVRQFATLPKIGARPNTTLAERENALERNFEAKVLGTNYRSRSTIVNFNNALFAHLRSLITSPELQGIYRSHEQEIKHAEEGFVSVQWGSLDAEALEDLNCSQTLVQIRQALNDGYACRDICVLARKNSQGNLIADYLVRNKVPVVSSDSLLLKNNLEVNTLVAYLRTLVSPRDQVSAAAVIAYLKYARLIDPGTLDELLKDITAGRPLASVLTSVGIPEPDQGELLNLSEHCLALVRSLKMETRAPQYVRFFLDEVNEFLVQKNPGIVSFLEWWEGRREKASLIIPADTDAVRIMTIHSSKGLEFPVVIVPFCNWPVHRNDQSAWVNVRSEQVKLPVGVISLGKKAEESGFGDVLEKEKEEEVLDSLNLLYVALTRAADRLHVICARSDGQRGTLVSDWLTSHLTANAGASGEYFETGRRLKKTGEHGNSMPVFELGPLDFRTHPGGVRIKTSPAVTVTAAGTARTHGILIHQLLSGIRVHADAEVVLGKALGAGLLSRDEMEEVRAQLQRILSKPELQDCFREGASLRLEAEIVTAGGEILRPDRVVFSGEEVLLVDYKTGREDHRKHGEQLSRYAIALGEMGHKRIKKLLVYLDSGEVVEVK